MTLDQLIDHLKDGLRATMNDVRAFSEDPDTEVRPEYLKTMSVARVLKDKMTSKALVRMEQETGPTLGASVLPKWRSPGFSCLVSRSGELDIVVSVEENGWKFPVVLVENKRYAAGYSSIKDDAIRCAEYIAAQGSHGSVEVAVVTYLRRETLGMTRPHLHMSANRALDNIGEKAAKLAAHLTVQHRHERVELDTSAFATDAEALALDEDGIPAYLTQPTFTVWGGMEVFWRPSSTSRLAKV